MRREITLIDFGSPQSSGNWEIVNDTVMGGLSQSSMRLTPDKTALFEGKVSLDNYGGFASVRTLPSDFHVEGSDGLLLRVKSDGKNYRLRLRTDDEHDGIAYQAVFSTERGKWETVTLPFESFVPVYRGSIVPDAPRPVDPRAIRRIGFMVADRQEGPFRLEIAWVKAYWDEDV